MKISKIIHPAVPLACVLCSLSGCDRAAPPPTEAARTVPGDADKSWSPGVAESRSVKQRQMTFLNRIRESDPKNRVIERALLNENNELGLILDRSVEMGKVPALMRTMLIEMAREFPGANLTVVAYAPSTPPRRIGTARLDGRTREMTYTPEG